MYEETTQHGYNASASSTFEDTDEEWTEWSLEYLPYYGKFALDTVWFDDDIYGNPTFMIRNATFGRILLGDSR
jgi:hypothetical protein